MKRTFLLSLMVAASCTFAQNAQRIEPVLVLKLDYKTYVQQRSFLSQSMAPKIDVDRLISDQDAQMKAQIDSVQRVWVKEDSIVTAKSNSKASKK